VKTLISLSCVSVLALSVAACASGTKAPSTTSLSMDDCKAHLAQFVPTQNKNDAALHKDITCANMVKK
jgi:hypothetical protein